MQQPKKPEIDEQDTRAMYEYEKANLAEEAVTSIKKLADNVIASREKWYSMAKLLRSRGMPEDGMAKAVKPERSKYHKDIDAFINEIESLHDVAVYVKNGRVRVQPTRGRYGYSKRGLAGFSENSAPISKPVVEEVTNEISS